MMHSTDKPSGSVPAFLTKLWRIVEDSKYDDLISWTMNGQSFVINQQSRFAKELLPLYFKHSNMASFIRQLNMYGFRKMVNLEETGLNSDQRMEFYHQFFSKGQEELLIFIKRKVSNSRPEDTNANKPEVSEILSDVKAIRGKQENFDNLLNNMKRENEALWREVAFLRQKHLKQQQIVEKLIQFLVTLVQPNGVNIGTMKRKVPLLLYNNNSGNNGAPEAKLQRLNRQISSASSNPGCSSNGPVIHDVTDALDPKPLFSNDNTDSDPLLTSHNVLPNLDNIPNPSLDEIVGDDILPSPDDQPLINSPVTALGTEDIEPLSVLVPLETTDELPDPLCLSPGTSTITPPADLQLGDLLKDRPNTESLNTPQVEKEGITLFSADNQMQVAISDPSQISNSPFRKRTLSECERSQFTDHLEGIESELDWLQDQIAVNAFNFDVSSLLTLFGSEDTVPGNNLPSDSLKYPSGGVTGNEVVQYLPNLHDFSILDDDSNQANNSVFESVASTSDLPVQPSTNLDPIADYLIGTTAIESQLNKDQIASSFEKSRNILSAKRKKI